jgi:hypothetical protein
MDFVNENKMERRVRDFSTYMEIVLKDQLSKTLEKYIKDQKEMEN